VYLLRSFLFAGLSSLAALTLLAGQLSQPLDKHLSTVQDAIRMTRLAAPEYFHGNDVSGRVATFSPDGKLFAIVLRKGNLEQNTNEFSLLVYRTADPLRSPKPNVLLRMSSSSNREAITQIRWLSDSETILFLGENPGESSQVYQLNVHTKQLMKRTSSAAPISDYDCAPDGRVILFRVDTPHDQYPGPDKEQIRRQGVVITDQTLQDLLAGRYGRSSSEQLFVQFRGHRAAQLHIPADNYVLNASALSISPDGEQAIVRANMMVRALPKDWAEYSYFSDPSVNDYLHRFFELPIGAAPTPFAQLLFVNTESSSIRPLWGAPVIGPIPIVWAKDSKSVLLASALLPLDGVSAEERSLRRKNHYDVAISPMTGQYQKISKEEFPKTEASRSLTEVSIEEDANTPPRIFVTDPATKQKSLLLDPNPQFSELRFGNVETIEWSVDGVNLIGGLYLPPDYRPGFKYPLVIQTHGFDPRRWSMDGVNEWSSGYAARPLAANGFLVLQLQDFKTRYDKDHYNDGNRFGVTLGQSGRNVNVRGIEGAIHYLEGRGLIDNRSLGIVGFSRSVSWVGYLLTHSSKHFAAASLVDGVDDGYFQELVYPQFAWDKDEKNGGASPFGEGLKTWLKESPSFSMGRVNTPIRLLSLGESTDVSEMWEWFAALRLQKKPVEYILLPDASHLVVKPWERIVAQQGLVDWFRFWLKNEEDPDPTKKEQYSRWRRSRQGTTHSASGMHADETPFIEDN